jgi:hypothetical protein
MLERNFREACRRQLETGSAASTSTFPATAVHRGARVRGASTSSTSTASTGASTGATSRWWCITAERHKLTPIARIPDPSSATITRFLGPWRARHQSCRTSSRSDDAKRVVGCRLLRARWGALLRSRPPGVLGKAGADRASYMEACNGAISVVHDDRDGPPPVAGRSPDRASAGRGLPELRLPRPRAVARAPGRRSAPGRQASGQPIARSASTRRASACASSS